MKAKPILFSAPMVQAILEQRKTQTRRVLRPQPVIDADGMWHWKDCQWMDGGIGFPESGVEDYAPYQLGDTLWVRETFTKIRDIETGHIDTFYAANKKDYDTVRSTYLCDDDGFDTGRPFPWKPSIHMPKVAARLFLRVVDVWVERLQDISEEDSIREGVMPDPPIQMVNGEMGSEWSAKDNYQDLWDKRNVKRGHPWESNPWVWVIEFEPAEMPQGWPEVAP